MNRVLFWDFDGTLAYCDHLWSNAVLSVLHNQGIDAALHDVRPHMATGYPWDITDSHTEIKNEAWWKYLYRKFSQVYEAFGVEKEEALQLAVGTRELILDIQKYFLYDDTILVLETAIKKGWKNYILSNNYPELRQTIDRLELSTYFTDFIISGEIGLDKPQPEIFEYAKRLAGYPKQCYMVGDNPNADIEGAKNAGIPAILVHKNVSSRADYTFDTLSEILPLL